MTASNVEGVRTGVRVYGYLPPSTHLVVLSDHRVGLPSPQAVAKRSSRPSRPQSCVSCD